MRRGKYGHGSVRQLPNGRWLAVVSAGTGPDGKRRRLSKTFATKSEAERGLLVLLSERERGRQSYGPPQTVDQFVKWWLASELPGRVRPDTVTHYRWIYEKYLKGRFGSRRLRDVHQREVVDLMSAMAAQGLSVETIRRARSILHLIFEDARRFENVPDNPVSRARPPRRSSLDETGVKPPLTTDEALHLLEVVRGTKLELIVALALSLGLRRGEVLALKWENVDFDAQVLHVRGTLKEGSTLLPDGTGMSRLRISPPKTRNSMRSVPLAAPLIDLLRRQRAAQATAKLRTGDAWSESGLVFTNSLGGALWPSSVYRQYKRLLAKNGIRDIRFHDLRHSAATIALTGGVRLESVSQILGHATIGITKDIYAPYVPQLINEAAEVVCRMLFDDRQEREAAVGDNGASPWRRSDRNPNWHGDR